MYQMCFFFVHFQYEIILFDDFGRPDYLSSDQQQNLFNYSFV